MDILNITTRDVEKFPERLVKGIALVSCYLRRALTHAHGARSQNSVILISLSSHLSHQLSSWREMGGRHRSCLACTLSYNTYLLLIKSLGVAQISLTTTKEKKFCSFPNWSFSFQSNTFTKTERFLYHGDYLFFFLFFSWVTSFWQIITVTKYLLDFFLFFLWKTLCFLKWKKPPIFSTFFNPSLQSSKPDK